MSLKEDAHPAKSRADPEVPLLILGLQHGFERLERIIIGAVISIRAGIADLQEDKVVEQHQQLKGPWSFYV